MRILILAQHFAPEEVSGAVLATELSGQLANGGHEVVFVTAAPSYPAGVVFDGYRNAPLTRGRIESVGVVRVWSYISQRKSTARRLINYGTFSLSAFAGGLAARAPDVIMCYSPPFPLGITAALLARLWRVPWLLRIEDLYPEAAIATGVLKNKTAIRLLHAIERWQYRKADHISVISETIRRNLAGKGVDPGRLSVTPVWADPGSIEVLSKRNPFSVEHNLNGRFVVMYAGNLGHTSSLLEVVQAAELLQDQPDISFVFVGEGIQKQSLESYSEDHGLANTIFLPFEPRDRVSEVLATASLGTVTLNPGSAAYSLPNKIFSVMASARPVLAVVPTDSEVAQIVRRGDCGHVVPPGEPEMLAKAILSLRENEELCTRMARNGRRILESEYSRHKCVRQIEHALLGLVE